MPRAMSSPSEPVGTDAMSSWRFCPSLSRMIAPLPYSFSTLAMASSRAAEFFTLLFFSSLMGDKPPGGAVRINGPDRRMGQPMGCGRPYCPAVQSASGSMHFGHTMTEQAGGGGNALTARDAAPLVTPL